uniref:Caprin-1 dimerization domain-containing protein n=1 Tax=Phytophthora ramorum TaxID=164328 RepID=H3GPL2_PHYRM
MASETFSIEKSETRAIVEARSESPARSVKSASSSGKKTKKAKSKVKAVVAAVGATHEMVDEEALSNLSGDHPYLSVLYKRIRTHRKKLEKIKSLEAQEGKVLNAQQLELMSNKATLEKLVAELEMLREQFLTVYRQEDEQKKQQEAEDTVVAGAVAAEAVEEVEQELEHAVEQIQVEEKKEEDIPVPEQRGEDFGHVYELLKTLHVVNLHQALGKEVPMVLDFFSKVLLGNTRPPAELSYEENLMESLEEAKKYLADSDKVFACDTTYSGLRAFVDQLATMSSPKTEEEQEEVEQEAVDSPEEAEGEDPSDIPVVPAEINTMPEISFFTESQLEEEQADEVSAEVEAAEVEPQEEVAAEVEGITEQHEGEVAVVVEAAVEAPPAPESVPAPPLSFAAVAAGGVQSERTPSPSGSSGREKKEPGSEDNSPRTKTPQRRRGQGRWREKGSNSSNGNKSSGNGSPTNGGKPRRPRGPRTNDENSAAQGDKRSGSKEVSRPRVDRALRKQGNPSQQPATPMIAPHA